MTEPLRVAAVAVVPLAALAVAVGALAIKTEPLPVDELNPFDVQPELSQRVAVMVDPSVPAAAEVVVATCA